MSTHPFRSWNDYVYPGTEVLKNKFDIRDANDLRRAEEDSSFIRMATSLDQDPVPGVFDRAHMKAIHRHLFGDVYEWAGEERVGPTSGQMTKGGPSLESIMAGNYTANDNHPYGYFPSGAGMVDHFDQYCRLLDRDDLQGAEPEEFADAIVEPWAEMNTAHLFREGNTRTQVVFFTYYARHHGHSLDVARFSTDPEFRHKFNAGRFLAQATVRYDLLKETLLDVIDTPPSIRPNPDGAPGVPDDYSPMYSAEEYADKYGVDPSQLSTPESRQPERRKREKDLGTPTGNGGRFA